MPTAGGVEFSQKPVIVNGNVKYISTCLIAYRVSPVKYLKMIRITVLFLDFFLFLRKYPSDHLPQLIHEIVDLGPYSIYETFHDFYNIAGAE